jgi:hypothetical protein
VLVVDARTLHTVNFLNVFSQHLILFTTQYTGLTRL